MPWLRRQSIDRRVVVCGMLILLASPSLARAHDGQPLAPHDLWQAWNWEPSLLLGLALVSWAYGTGVRRLWRRAGVGHGVARWQVAAFASGIAALVVALVSPLDALGSVLFTAHMLQHLVLVVIAAPLLVLGAPALSLLWALPQPWRQKIVQIQQSSRVSSGWHILTRPLVVWGLHLLALFIWHMPRLYEAALRSELVHALEHGSFFGTALLFWWALIYPDSQYRLGYGAGVLYIFATAIPSGVLAALITLAERPWYPAYAGSVAAWGLTPLEDQQLAGLLMWMPASLIYLLAALALFAAWLRGVERQIQRREQALTTAPPLSQRATNNKNTLSLAETGGSVRADKEGHT